MNRLIRRMVFIILISMFIITLGMGVRVESKPTLSLNKPVEINISVDIDSSYNAVLEEIRIYLSLDVLSNYGLDFPSNLWDDIGGALYMGTFDLDNTIKEFVNKELERMGGGELEVVAVQFYTSDISQYKKFENNVIEIVIRMWVVGAVHRSSTISHIVDLSVLKISPIDILHSLNLSPLNSLTLEGYEIPKLNMWISSSVKSSSILPFSRPLPAYRKSLATSLVFEDIKIPSKVGLEIITPPDTVFSGVNEFKLTYTTVGDMLVVSIAVFIIAAVVIYIVFHRKR